MALPHKFHLIPFARIAPGGFPNLRMAFRRCRRRLRKRGPPRVFLHLARGLALLAGHHGREGLQQINASTGSKIRNDTALAHRQSERAFGNLARRVAPPSVQ